MSPGNDGMAAAPISGLTQVTIGKVEDALADRRRTLLTKLAHPTSRTCVMTLVIAVEDERENRSSVDIVNQIAGKYPLRVIVVGHDDKERDTLSAWVNLECEGQDSHAMCSEEIILQGGAESADRVISSVRSLVRTDLPVMLWWRGGVPFPNMLWQGLFSISDRVIVDSHRFTFDLGGLTESSTTEVARPDGRSALAVLRELVQQSGTRACIRDLNWQRTSPWRNAVATCFDDSDMLALLPQLNRCSLTFCDQSKSAQPSARSMLVAGWLMDRLPRLHRSALAFGPGSHWPTVQQGRIVAIALTSSSSKASLVLARQTAPSGILAQANGLDGKTMRRWDFGASTLTEAELLDGCLETIGRDTLFEKAIQISL